MEAAGWARDSVKVLGKIDVIAWDKGAVVLILLALD